MSEKCPIVEGQPELKLKSTRESFTVPNNDVEVTLNNSAITKFLFIIVLFLLVMHGLSFLCYYQLQEGHFTKAMLRLFDLGKDFNIPTLFSTILLLTASIILFFIQWCSQKRIIGAPTKHWLILGVIFLFLSIDESVRLHEETIDTIRNRMPFKVTGYFYNAWVIPYGLFVIAVAGYFLPFLAKLPRRTRNLMVVAGVVYVAGALGLEMVEGKEEIANGKNGLVHIYETFEEVMEMTGVIIFIYALLDFLKIKKIKFEIENAN